MIVSPGPSIAITRVVKEPGAMPIQIDSIGLLLARRRRRHKDGCGLRGRNLRCRGNFSATRVRFDLPPIGSPPARASSGLAPALVAPPVPLFAALTSSLSLRLVTRVVAVHLTTIAAAAKVKYAAAVVDRTLNLPQIVQPRARLPTIRPPSGPVRQPSCRARPLAATTGSELHTPGPLLFATAPRILALAERSHQITRPSRPARIPALLRGRQQTWASRRSRARSALRSCCRTPVPWRRS